jgi:hypothetical protein
VITVTKFNYEARRDTFAGIQEGALSATLALRKGWEQRYSAAQLAEKLEETAKCLNKADMEIMLLYGKPCSDAFERDVTRPLQASLAMQESISQFAGNPRYERFKKCYDENRDKNYEVLGERVKWWVEYLASLPIQSRADVPPIPSRSESWPPDIVVLPRMQIDSKGEVAVVTEPY